MEELKLVVHIKGGVVTGVEGPPDCKIHIFDYDKGKGHPDAESDGKGGWAKQVIWHTLGTKNPKYLFKVLVKDDKVFNVIFPVRGAECTIKSYKTFLSDQVENQKLWKAPAKK